MRILYYHQHFSTPDGSGGTRSYEFAKKLISNGHTVTIVCGSYWLAKSGLNNKFENGVRKGVVDKINVIEFDLSYSNSDSFFKRSLIFFKYSLFGIYFALKEDYDLLFATSTPLTAGIPGIVARLLKKKKFVFEVRDLWPELPKAMGVITNPFILKTMEILEMSTYKFSEACIGLSPGIVKGIKKKFPMKRVELIPNGCDLKIVKGIKDKKTLNNKLVAAFTGAHGYANGLESVLDAAEILLKRSELDIEIQFIGDGALKPKLIKKKDKKELTNCVFIDPMPKIELFKYLKQNVDIGLMILENIPAFYYGTSPNKFFDYISLGLPVLNNYPGWLAEMISENNCGIAVAPSKPIEFANALIKLKNNKDIIFEMGNNAKKLAIEQFDRDALSTQFSEFLESIRALK